MIPLVCLPEPGNCLCQDLLLLLLLLLLGATGVCGQIKGPLANPTLSVPRALSLPPVSSEPPLCPQHPLPFTVCCPVLCPHGSAHVCLPVYPFSGFSLLSLLTISLFIPDLLHGVISPRYTLVRAPNGTPLLHYILQHSQTRTLAENIALVSFLLKLNVSIHANSCMMRRQKGKQMQAEGIM